MSDKDIANKLLVVIGGSTGVGKTSMAIQLAQHYQTEIVSADSRQVYKELNIGVGKPSASQLEAIPHHLIGNASIFQNYSAGQFTTDALQILESLFSLHDIVFLTGGTGLYVKAIMEGFDPIPVVPESISQHWTQVWHEKGTKELLDTLEKIDPEYLLKVDHSNHMRLIRAIAVSVHSGKPFSSFHTKKIVSRPFRILPIVLELPREELYSRIDQRVLDMIAHGWMEEARSLYPHRQLKALQTVGYKELFDVIDGHISLEEAIPMIQQSTRRYAKRQMTWWRNQGEWNRFHPGDSSLIIKRIDEHQEFGREQGAGSRENI